MTTNFVFIFSFDGVADVTRSCQNEVLVNFAVPRVFLFTFNRRSIHYIGCSIKSHLGIESVRIYDSKCQEIHVRDVFQGKKQRWTWDNSIQDFFSFIGKFLPCTSVLSIQQYGTHDSRLKGRRSFFLKLTQWQRWNHGKFAVNNKKVFLMLSDFEHKSAKHFWTSGTDLGDEGKFFYLSNGRDVGQLSWAQNEPNNARKADSNETENCIAFTMTENLKFYRLFDRFCSLQFNFVCQTFQITPLNESG